MEKFHFKKEARSKPLSDSLINYIDSSVPMHNSGEGFVTALLSGLLLVSCKKVVDVGPGILFFFVVYDRVIFSWNKLNPSTGCI